MADLLRFLSGPNDKAKHTQATDENNQPQAFVPLEPGQVLFGLEPARGGEYQGSIYYDYQDAQGKIFRVNMGATAANEISLILGTTDASKTHKSSTVVVSPTGEFFIPLPTSIKVNYFESTASFAKRTSTSNSYFYKNGLIFTDGNAKNTAYIDYINAKNAANDAVLELATRNGTDTNHIYDSIVVRQYDSDNEIIVDDDDIAREAILLGKNAESYFPGPVTSARGFIGNITGHADSAEKAKLDWNDQIIHDTYLTHLKGLHSTSTYTIKTFNGNYLYGENGSELGSITIEGATTTQAGLVTTGAQTWTGNKTFDDQTTVTVQKHSGFKFSGIAEGTGNVARPVWFSRAEGTTADVQTPVYNNNFTFNPSTGELKVTKVIGTLDGIATQAQYDVEHDKLIHEKYLKLTGGIMTGDIQFKGSQSLYWSDGNYRQRITIQDDANAHTPVFFFQQSEDAGKTFKNLMTIQDDSNVIAKTFTGDFIGDLLGNVTGNADTATEAVHAQTAQTALMDGDGNIIADTFVHKIGDTMTGALEIHMPLPTSTPSNPEEDIKKAVHLILRDPDDENVLTGTYLGSHNGSGVFATANMNTNGFATQQFMTADSSCITAMILGQGRLMLLSMDNTSSNSLDTFIGAPGQEITHIYAKNFHGDLLGNATTATNATNAATAEMALKDGNGKIIADTYLPLAGGTLTGALTGTYYTAKTQFSLASGKVADLAAGTTRLYGNGIVISNPGTANDQGWIRMVGSSEQNSILEIATGDDGNSAAGNTTREEIYVRQYGTGNDVRVEIKLLDKSGNTTFPGTVTAPKFIGALEGNATSADYATNAGSAGTALKDGDGKIIADTYLKLAGGTMTGDINACNIFPTTTGANKWKDLGSSSKRWGGLYIDYIDNSGDYVWNGHGDFRLVGKTANADWTFQLEDPNKVKGTHFNIYSAITKTTLADFFTDNGEVRFPTYVGIGGAGDSQFGLKAHKNVHLTQTTYFTNVAADYRIDSNANAYFNKMQSQNITDSANSVDANASTTVKGGLSVFKQLSAKTVKIDNNSTSQGCTLNYNENGNYIEFVFA